MRHKIFLFLNSTLFILLFAACSNKQVLDEERVFNRGIWNRFTPEVFSFDVPDAEDFYHIDITFVIDTALYRYTEVPLTLNLESPAGEKRFIPTTVPLKEHGRWRGEMRDGYRVVTGRTRSYFSFNHTGTHHLAVGQRTSQYDLEGVRGMTVNITKAKIDYSHLD